MSVDFVFFDSGTGGIPYMQALKKACPSAICVYLADTVNFPYGTKTPDEVTLCASEAVSLIIRKWNPSAVVVACNTVSVTSLSVLRKRFPGTPIVGTVPAIKLAAKISKNRRIGLLATEGTVNHPYTADLEQKFAADCTLITRADTDLVSFVEHSLFTATEVDRKKAVLPAVDFFTEKECDTIILGCTHFIHVADDIAAAAGGSVQVVDSRAGVVRRALNVVSCRHPGKRKLFESVFSVLTGFLKEKIVDQSLFVTGFRTPTDFSSYRMLCSRLGIPWGGIVQEPVKC